jgi:NAD(P)-dependent dehydrogenase (short-subunit alcohol dehydrogenase family)
VSELMLEGKSVLVAGIGPGLGRSIAMAATAAGADVALVARRQGPLDELAADLAPTGRQVVTVAADVTVPADCARVARSVIDAFGGLDALVYNAYAPSLGTTLVDADLDEWRQVMEVNAFGALELLRPLLDTLAERQGSVVLINTRQLRRPTNGAYVMSKGALMAIGQVLAHELGPSGIRVNSVVPGWMWAAPVEDYFTRQAAAGGPSIEAQYDAVAGDFPLRRLPTAGDVANSVVFLASDQAAAITGQALDVNAGEIFT